MFYDLVHPTSVLHRQIANEFAPYLAAADVPLPGIAWLTGVGLVGLYGTRRWVGLR